MNKNGRINLLFGCGVVLSLFAFGCAARQPSPLESVVMTEVKRKITVGGRKETNPLADTMENINSGRRVFSYRCVFCHGPDGQNTGVPFADRMSPPVPLLCSSGVQDYSDGQLKWIIENGLYPSGMPSFRGILTQDDIWRVVHYIRHLPSKGGRGNDSVGQDQRSTDSDLKTNLMTRHSGQGC